MDTKTVDVARKGELCCKETEYRWLFDSIEEIPQCGKQAAHVILCDDGERLPFCEEHWTNIP